MAVTQEELKKISAVQVAMMDDVHRLCQEYGITYYMIGGTLLGAVRHGGFIPWDLDIDIAMPREDYERFKSFCLAQMSEKYEYCDLHSVRNYVRPHAILCAKNTKIHLKYDHLNPKRKEFGIYLDIFPLDNAPNEAELQKKQGEKLRKIRKLKEKRLFYSYSYKAFRRFVHYGIALLLSWIPLGWINRCQQKEMQKYRGRETDYLCSMASGYPYRKQCMPREIYGVPTLLCFEGREYFAPEKYKEYLERLYGDYMKLPPEEARQANLEVYHSVEFLK